MEVDKRSRLLHEVLMGIELQLKHPGADIPELTKRKLGILLELRQYQGVLHEGLCFVGSEGPDPLVFKHIVSALCHTAKVNLTWHYLIYISRFKDIASHH